MPGASQGSRGRPLVLLAALAAAAAAWTAAAGRPAHAAAVELQSYGRFGQVSVYRRTERPKGVAIVLSGEAGWDAQADALARNLESLDALVIGLDLPFYLRKIERLGQDCAFPAGDFEMLSKLVQKKLDLPSYTPPVLAGYGIGAALAYAALAQAPPDTFAGAISLGFCPEVEIAHPFCKGRGLESKPVADDQSQHGQRGGRGQRGRSGPRFQLLPVAGVEQPWIVVASDGGPRCPAAAAAQFAAKVRGAVAVAPLRSKRQTTPAQRFGSPLKQSFLRVLNAADLARPPETAVRKTVADLPILELPVPGSTGDAMAVVISGDGGWAGLDRQVAKLLVDRGIPVVGLNTLQYFWTPRNPDGAAADLARLLRTYLAAWNRREALLIGYSLGGEVLPFMAARLPADLLGKVRLIALLGPGRTTSFEFRLREWLGRGGGEDRPVLPELAKLDARKVLCVYGSSEKAESLCSQIGKSGTAVELPGAHYLGGDAKAVVEPIWKQLEGGQQAAAPANPAPAGGPAAGTPAGAPAAGTPNPNAKKADAPATPAKTSPTPAPAPAPPAAPTPLPTTPPVPPPPPPSTAADFPLTPLEDHLRARNQESAATTAQGPFMFAAYRGAPASTAAAATPAAAVAGAAFLSAQTTQPRAGTAAHPEGGRTETGRPPGGSEPFTYGRFGETRLLHRTARPANVVLFFTGDEGWSAATAAMATALAAQEALVVGINSRTYLGKLAARQEKCALTAESLENLSKVVQKRLGFTHYVRPLVAGYSAGATLAYGALAQAPPNTFRGGLGLGFCADLADAPPLCSEHGLITQPAAGGNGFHLAPAAALEQPWIALQGESDQRCPASAAQDYARPSPGGEVVSLPGVDHGFTRQAGWEQALRLAVQKLLKPPPAPPNPAAGAAETTGSSALPDLPLIEMPAGGAPGEELAVIISGDGGWAGVDREVGKVIAGQKGMPVVGLDTLQYFWNERTPDAAAADLERVLRHYLSAWNRKRALLIGYSLGADVLPFMASRLPADLRGRIRLIALIGPSHTTPFEIRVKENKAAELPVLPEVAKLRGLPLLCLFGKGEQDSICPDLEPGLGERAEMPGSHLLGGGYQALAERILQGAAEPAAAAGKPEGAGGR
ncbi:MAG TPA: AcvB/VirJ family lysyl-phosphatidylglycerol hydrolase [Thermoanaerobaculia bacterium]|nr:AcvB/VirJ family lysyl-phosphatidylglycerol hydrolase [Thermoanaerobaculia bacterium]